MLWLYKSSQCILLLLISTVNQVWELEQVHAIPGVFRIAMTKVEPDSCKLYITVPLDPQIRDNIYLQAKIQASGHDAEQQLWQFVPVEIDSQYSRIQNYASPGLYINIPNGKSGQPLHLFKHSDYYYDSFYAELI